MTPAVVVQLPLFPDSNPGFSRRLPLGGGGGGGGGGAAPRSEYSKRLGEPVPGLEILFGVELSLIAAHTVAGDALGFPARYSAATPATCGVAMDVPLIVFVAVVLVYHADV